MSRETVLILGANGRMGLSAAQAFSAAGWQVLAQVRRAADPAMPADAIVIQADPFDTPALLAAVKRHTAQVPVVVHCLNPWYTNADWRREVLPLGRAGMRAARGLDALLMLPGNIYNFGAGLPAVLTEDTPFVPTTVKGRIRCELEAELEQEATRGLRTVVLRAGDFFGGGSGSAFDMIITKYLAKGRLIYPGPHDPVHAWAYLPDLARTFVRVAEARAQLPAFSSLHFPGHNISSQTLLDAIETAARELGIAGAAPLRRRDFPWWLIRLLGPVVPLLGSIVEMRYQWWRPHAVESRRLQALIGTIPSTPLAASVRQGLLDLGYGEKAALRPVGV